MQKLFLISVILLVANFSYAFETKATYAYLSDYETNAVLFEKNADEQMAPSSMSKIMTAYIAFEELKSGHIKLDNMYPISEKAWRMEGTRMFIPLNAQVSFEDLLKGLIIQSGNDAAVAIAEIISGTEEEFADRMNETAKKLGMINSNFTNASGLPEKNNYSTARDLAILSKHTIMDFPEYYHYYSMTEFTYNNIVQGNKNGLLYRNIGADGIKTGHAEDAGYGLVGSVKKGDRRLISVVNGLKSKKERNLESEALLSYGMMNFINMHIAKKGQVIEKIKVNNGDEKEVEVIVDKDIVITVPKKDAKSVKLKLKYNTPISAPVAKGDPVAELSVEVANENNMVYPLVASKEIGKAGFFKRIQNNLSSFFD